MPAETKTAVAEPFQSLEGAVFQCISENDRIEAIDQAFDYRGDVTLDLSSGETITGYMSNRDAGGSPPRIEIFIRGQDTPRVIPYADITAVAFTGEDTANGKSWHDWINKKESERKAETERIKQELAAQGHL
jgi:hypothetical protein